MGGRDGTHIEGSRNPTGEGLQKGGRTTNLVTKNENSLHGEIRKNARKVARTKPLNHAEGQQAQGEAGSGSKERKKEKGTDN